ncbi:unnamed protein product [Sphenostylis stenocarpa]|uniref:Uncharacterized protein n=1 Tax=Sphenostylis stenocarpa TaxID=92480 RepID=A0AA86W339_9FABA|nr:unnamed protein product [Sphenostylis stenocarpa]
MREGDTRNTDEVVMDEEVNESTLLGKGWIHGHLLTKWFPWKNVKGNMGRSRLCVVESGGKKNTCMACLFSIELTHVPRHITVLPAYAKGTGGLEATPISALLTPSKPGKLALVGMHHLDTRGGKKLQFLRGKKHKKSEGLFDSTKSLDIYLVQRISK